MATTKPVIVPKIRSRKAAEESRVNEFLDIIADDPRFSKINQKAKEETTPKLNLLQRAGKLLTSFSSGDAVYKSLYEGKSFAKEYTGDIGRKLKEAITGRPSEEVGERERTYKDVLTRAGFIDKPGKVDLTDIAGFGFDVLADPTTFIPGKAISAVLSRGAKLARKIPFVPEISEGLSRAFKPQTKRIVDSLKAVGDQDVIELASKFEDAQMRFSKGGTVTINNAVADMAKIEREVSRAVGKERVPQIAEIIETGVKSGDTLLDEQADMLSQFYQQRLKSLKDAGVEVSERNLYSPHVATNEYLALKNKAVRTPTAVGRPLRVKLESGIEREFSSFADEAGERLFGNAELLNLTKKGDSFVDEAGKVYREIPPTIKEANEWSMRELGVKIFEDNPYKAQAKYFMDTEKALRTKKFLDEMRNMGKFAEEGKSEVVDAAGIKWVQPKAKALENVLLPKEVADYLDTMSNILAKDESSAQLLQWYDKVLNIWKGSVYGWFPSSHTTNMIGGLFHNYVAGAVDPRLYMLSEKLIRKAPFEEVIRKGADAGKKLSSKKLAKELDEYGVVGQVGYLDVPENLQRLPGNGKLIRKIGDMPAKFMGKIEDRLRIPLYLDGRLRLGLSPKEAAQRVIKFHFDYSPSGLSTFERNVMKRIIPFYTFTRNAIPLTIEQMLTNPAKYAAVFKAQQATGLRPEDEDVRYLPKYLQQQILLRSKTEDGDKIYAGFKLPFEETIEFIETPFRGFISSTAPVYKIPIEVVTGKNIFKDIDLKEDTNGYNFRNAPGFFKDFLEYTEVDVPVSEKTGKGGYTRYFVNPFKKYAVENFPFTSRLLNTLLRVANGEDVESKVVPLFTAIKEYETSEISRKSVYEKQLLLELQDMLERLGGGYYYTQFIHTSDEDRKERLKVPTK